MSATLSRPAPIVAPTRLAAAMAAVAVLVVAAVWSLEIAGFAPCELCLKERVPFYAAVPLTGLVAWLSSRRRNGLAAAGFAALAIIFAAGAAIGAYHAGVERKLWEGPSTCTGSIAQPTDVADFMKQLQTTQVVRCDAPALHVAGLSLAEWNVVACLLLAGSAIYGFRLSDARPR